MKCLLYSLGLCVFASVGQIAIAQADSAVASSAEVEKMLHGAFLNEVNIQAPSIREATQQLCDLLADKQSVQNEKKIIFSVNVPPVTGAKISFQEKFKRGSKMLELFCQQYDLLYTIENGIIHLQQNTRSDNYIKSLNTVKNISIPEIKVTAEYLPSTLRSLLQPHQLTFTIQSPKKRKNGSDRPLTLEQTRISDYRKKNTNLFVVLNDLASEAKMQAWITPQGITFTKQNAEVKKIIKASKFSAK